MLDFDFSLIFLGDSKASEARIPGIAIASLLGCARLRGGWVVVTVEIEPCIKY